MVTNAWGADKAKGGRLDANRSGQRGLVAAQRPCDTVNSGAQCRRLIRLRKRQLTTLATPPIRATSRRGGRPGAVLKIEVVKIQALLYASILWEPTASFTSEWERMRHLRFVDAQGA